MCIRDRIGSVATTMVAYLIVSPTEIWSPWLTADAASMLSVLLRIRISRSRSCSGNMFRLLMKSIASNHEFHLETM